jgi:hypothetical protein
MPCRLVDPIEVVAFSIIILLVSRHRPAVVRVGAGTEESHGRLATPHRRNRSFTLLGTGEADPLTRSTLLRDVRSSGR